MHDQNAQGNDYFKCDFCRRSWAEDRPMVEGHQGSLICAQCLSASYAEVVNAKGGVEPPEGVKCTLCLEDKAEMHWESPMFPGTFACRRCVNQSARILEKDKEYGWKRPGAA